MIKYTFAVHHASYRQFLDDLQELGVLHVNRGREKKIEGEAAILADEASKISALRGQLKIYKPTEQKETVPAAMAPAPSVTEIIEQGNNLLEKLNDNRAALEQLEETIEARVVWGDYSDGILAELQNSGIGVSFYTIPAKKFNRQWPEDFPVEIISSSSKEIHFVFAGASPRVSGATPGGTSAVASGVVFEGAKEVIPPREEIRELTSRADILKKEITACKSKLEQLALVSTKPLEDKFRVLQDRLEWLDIRDNRTSPAVEGMIYILEGWVPETEQDKLNRYLEDKGILYFKSTDTKGENPPIKLRNNRFSRLFEPIGNLFSLPDYAELDLTVYFAPFFMLFFGFCLGDSGYGMLILLGSTIGKRFVSGPLKGYLSLAQLFGLSTMVVGFICGTFFGLELAKIPALDNIKGIFLDSNNVFSLALIIGAVQIVFGIMLRVRNQLRQPNPSLALGSIGWLLLFFTAGLFEFLLAGADPSTVLKIGRIALYSTSLFFILFFSGTGSVFARFGSGIWDIYSNVTGIFGDLLSYIRLFALGVASSILGLVVNQMAVAFGKAPYIGPIIFFLIIIVGHIANLAISSLGSFVHPMRLTFVEFYKNAGFKGGGKSYKPFGKQ